MPPFLASSALVNPVTVEAATASSDVLVIIGGISAVLLVGLLVLREIVNAYRAEPHVASSMEADALENFARATNSALVPLAAVFAVAIIVKIVELL